MRRWLWNRRGKVSERLRREESRTAGEAMSMRRYARMKCSSRCRCQASSKWPYPKSCSSCEGLARGAFRRG